MDGLGGYYAKWNNSEKDKYSVISLIHEIWKKKEKTKQNQTHIYREQMGNCQDGGVRDGEIGEGNSEVWTSRYKMNKSWECNIQHEKCGQ